MKKVLEKVQSIFVAPGVCSQVKHPGPTVKAVTYDCYNQVKPQGIQNE